MRIIFFLFSILFFSFLHAHDALPQIPTPFYNGINVITGQTEEKFPHANLAYDNQNRIIKFINNNESIEFHYYQNSTEVIENKIRKNIFHFTSDKLINALEHYENSDNQWKLYRKEKLFWKTQAGNSSPTLSCRVLEDGEGRLQTGYNCEFNENGQLISETLFGNLSGKDNKIECYSTKYEYDADNPDLLLLISEDNGLITRYQYDPLTKQCTAKLRGNGQEILTRYFYEYDECGCLSKTIVDDGQGSQKEDLTGVSCRKMMLMQNSHAPASYGQPLLVENRYLDLTTGQEMLLDRLVCCYSPEGELLRQDFYDANGDLDHSIGNQNADQMPETASGNDPVYSYDAFGRITETNLPAVLDVYDQPYCPKIMQEYTIGDLVNKYQDAMGNVTTMTYNLRGKPVKINYPDGSCEHFTYFLDGELKEKIDRQGKRTCVVKDALGRIASRHEYSSADQLLSELFYTYQGNLIRTISDHQTFTIYYEYDGAGRQISAGFETKEGIKKSTCTYSPTGQRIESNQQTAPSTKIEDSNALFMRENIVCNKLGQFVKQSESVDKLGVKQLLTYDALDRLENCSVFNSLGMKITEHDCRYNANGQKILERHSRIYQGEKIGTYSIGWEYDVMNRLIAIHEALDTPFQKSTYYQYNNKGQLLHIQKPNGLVISYGYNEKDLPAKLTSSDGTIDYAYEYDALNRLVQVRDCCHGTSQTFSYNAFNQLIEESNDGISIKYVYDDSGRKISLELPDDTGISYLYERNQLKSIQRIGNDQSIRYTHEYDYDQNSGCLAACRLINNLGIIKFNHHKNGMISEIQSPWWSEKLSFDELNRLISANIEDPNGQSNHSYAYSDDGQLTQENGSISKNYGYDSIYNRMSEDSQDLLVNENNQLMRTPTTHFNYDINGNLIRKNKTAESHLYQYDALNRLIRFEIPQSIAVEYHYDAFNRRMKEISYSWNHAKSIWEHNSTNRFLFDGENEIGKIDQSGQITELRVLGYGRGAEIGSAVALEIHGRLFAPIHDCQGSVRCLIDAETRSASEYYRYDCYGMEEIFDSMGQKQIQSIVHNPWRFLSKRMDENSRLVFFGKRYYDPEIGRWITQDPLFFADAPNLYAFVKNDAVNNCDLYGLFTLSDLWYTAKQTFITCANYFNLAVTKTRQFVRSEMRVPRSIHSPLERVCRKVLGDNICLLFGFDPAQSSVDAYGEKEISSKVRVTYINGILTTDVMLQENLDLISSSHGGVKVHYIFRGTKGWTSDIWRAILIKNCYYFGYRSMHAHLLAQKWRELIDEMGGVDGGGIIIHYAHSLGGSETDRARLLLTPEEQKMIRVYTFGTATLVRNEGFQNVINVISANDGVSSIFLDPLGHIRNIFDKNSNVRRYGKLNLIPYLFSTTMWPTDHLLSGFTYRPILRHLGQSFIDEFA